jgi:hypothetical protein
MKISEILFSHLFSMRVSVSAKAMFNLCPRALPTEDFPDPGGPIRIAVSMAT